MSSADRPATRAIGWTLIALVGGAASVASVAILVLGLFIVDTLVLAKTETGTSYLTVVAQKGVIGDPGHPEGFIYELRDEDGGVTTAHLPWAAHPGDRIRFRHGRTRLLRLTVPVEAPSLCRQGTACP